MNTVERAAEVVQCVLNVQDDALHPPLAVNIADALADAGLLVSDGMRAVIDAASAVKAAWIADDDHLWMDANVNLLDAVDAYIAAGDDQ